MAKTKHSHLATSQVKDVLLNTVWVQQQRWATGKLLMWHPEFLSIALWVDLLYYSYE